MGAPFVAARLGFVVAGDERSTSVLLQIGQRSMKRL
jgi:hypothetical protein